MTTRTRTIPPIPSPLAEQVSVARLARWYRWVSSQAQVRTDTPVTVTGNAAFTAAGGTVSAGTGAIRDVTLPNTAGTTYSLTVTARGYDDATVPVTVTAAPSTGLGTLTVSKDGAQVGTQQQVLVSASPAPSSDFSFHGYQWRVPCRWR